MVADDPGELPYHELNSDAWIRYGRSLVEEWLQKLINGPHVARKEKLPLALVKIVKRRLADVGFAADIARRSVTVPFFQEE